MLYVPQFNANNTPIERDVDLHVVVECLKICRYFTIEASKFTKRSAEYSEISRQHDAPEQFLYKVYR